MRWFLMRWFKNWWASISRIKVGVVELERSVVGNRAGEIEKLSVLLATLEQQEAFGTVDAPREYIKDALPMFSRLIPSRPSYQRERRDPGLVYSGGSTAQTVIALVGSPFHLLDRVREISEEPSSDLPNLVGYLNERFGALVDDCFLVEDHGICAIEHADGMNKDPRICMEFVAWRILDSADIQGFTPKKRLLLYSPLYVAYAPDPPAHP